MNSFCFCLTFVHARQSFVSCVWKQSNQHEGQKTTNTIILAEFGSRPGYTPPLYPGFLALAFGGTGILVSIGALIRLSNPSNELRGRGLAKAGITIGALVVVIALILMSQTNPGDPELRALEKALQNLR